MRYVSRAKHVGLFHFPASRLTNKPHIGLEKQPKLSRTENNTQCNAPTQHYLASRSKTSDRAAYKKGGQALF